jgi:hypothetical protein
MNILWNKNVYFNVDETKKIPSLAYDQSYWRAYEQYLQTLESKPLTLPPSGQVYRIVVENVDYTIVDNNLVPVKFPGIQDVEKFKASVIALAAIKTENPEFFTRYVGLNHILEGAENTVLVNS